MELVRRERVRTERLVRVGGDEDGSSVLTVMLSILAIVVILGLLSATSASSGEGEDNAGT
jgi:hypothetical protein